MAGAERALLAETVASHARQLAGLVPRFAPGWLPRTDDRIAIPLAGGRVVLHGVADLLVGVPQPGVASLCALGLTTGGPWARERRSLHFVALLETLRSGRRRSAWPCWSRRRGGTGSRTCERNTCGPWPPTYAPGWPERTRWMAEELTRALVSPLPPFDEVAWESALADARDRWPTCRSGGPGAGPSG